MTKYVLGFVFDDLCENVILICKNKPEWQAGLLNGIGGKIEEGEMPVQAMSRESWEEIGTCPGDSAKWTAFGQLQGEDFHVILYAISHQDMFDVAQTMEKEQVGQYLVAELPELKTVSNVAWLVHMAIDRIALNETPFLATIQYLPV